jgi:ABC-type antimicrobial peptide transport system permease subunit
VTAVLRYALARLAVRRGRTLLAVLGIAAAGAMLGAAVTVGYELDTGFERTAARARLADVVATFSPASKTQVAGVVAGLANVRAYAFRLQSSGEHVVAGGQVDDHATVVGVGSGPRGYAVVAGRDVSRAGQAVVEAGLARAWHLRIGQQLALSDYRGGSASLRIVGEAVSPETVAFPLAHGPRVYTSYEDERRLVGAEPGSVNSLLVWLHDPRLVDVTLAQARSAGFGLSGVQFVTRTGLRALIGQAAGIVVALLVAFSVVALVVAGTMLAASASAEVERRLGALGLLRAIGVSRREIVLGSSVEAVAVALPAGAVGIAGGWLAVAQPTDRLLASLNQLGPGGSILPLLVGALAGLTALVAAATAWPAWRAARRPAVETLRGADVVGAVRRLPLPTGTISVGLRLVLARPVRTAATTLVVACATAIVLLILTIASVLQNLDRQPQAIGKRYELSVSAPAAAAERVARLSGVAAAAPRYQVDAADSFALDEPFELIAFPGDHTRFEAPPLASGRRLRSDSEAEVGLGLADALGLHPGATLAAQLPSGKELRFRVVGVVRAFQDQGRLAYVLPRRLLAADPDLPATIAVRLRPGVRSSDVEGELARDGFFASQSGGIAGQSVQGWAARSSGFLGVVVALLRSVAVINGLVCLYAVAQVLALTAHERRRALAIIRSYGASRVQTVTVFAAAAGLIALFAAPLAIVLERLVIGPVVSALAASYVSLSLASGASEIGLAVAGLAVGSAVVAIWVGRAATARPIVAGLREE